MSEPRDPSPSQISRSSMAKREHLKSMGQSWSEPEPDVIVVVRWTGEKHRWVRRMGTEFYELVGEAT